MCPSKINNQKIRPVGGGGGWGEGRIRVGEEVEIFIDYPYEAAVPDCVLVAGGEQSLEQSFEEEAMSDAVLTSQIAEYPRFRVKIVER